MDGPNVNWKFLDLFHDYIQADCGGSFLNIVSCGLHIVHGALKDGSAASEWNLDGLFHSCHWLFNDTPTRREDYTSVTGSTKFPLRFCKHCWLENVLICERVLELLPQLRIFVESVNNKKINNPKTQSYDTVVTMLKDPLLEAKLQSFLSIAKQLTPFLAVYQTDRPLIPLLSDDLFRVLKGLMEQVISSDGIRNNGSSVNGMLKVDVTEKKTQCVIQKVDICFTAEQLVKKPLSNKRISDRQVMDIRARCKGFIIKIITKLQHKCPLKYKLVRVMNCLNPREILTNPDQCVEKFGRIVKVLCDAKKLGEVDCDPVLQEYRMFLDDVVPHHKSQLEQFCHTCPASRIDELFYKLLASNRNYANLWPVIRNLLLLSHGQATVERGFSTNKEISVENLQERSFVAKRIVLDHLHVVGGPLQVEMTKKLVMAGAAARQKYVAYLEDERIMKAKNTISRKRKDMLGEIELLKTKKRCLESAMQRPWQSSQMFFQKKLRLHILVLQR